MGQWWMVVSKGAAMESGIGWRQSWTGVSSGVGDRVVADFGRGQQRSRGWGDSDFRYCRGQKRSRGEGSGG